MSLTASDIFSQIDANCGTTIVSYPLAQKVIDINLALDNFFAIALSASGKWQLDDSNHLKDPILTTNLVSGQRDYHFTTDEQGNLILDVYRIMVADTNGIFYDLDTVDQQSKPEAIGMVDGQNKTGKPTQYDKTGNGIFLDLIPNYSVTGGLKFFINREASYFTVSDTTKKPGFAGLLHEYLVIRPSYYFTTRKGLKNAGNLGNELIKWEGDEDRGLIGKIARHYGRRSKDEQSIITSEQVNSI